MIEILNPVSFRSFLPHESSHEKPGTFVGGTGPGVATEAIKNKQYASQLILEKYGVQTPVEVVLDTPDPNDNSPVPTDMGLTLVRYKTPLAENGEPQQVWDMHNTYINDKGWFDQHKAIMQTPGRHVNLDHHTLGMGLGTELAQYAREDETVRAIRGHSELYAKTKQNKEYWPRYEGKKGTDYFWNTQRDALQNAQLVFFPTQEELDLSKAAVVKEGILTVEEMTKKSRVVGIPLDLGKFKPADPEGEIRARQIRELNKRIKKEYKPENGVGFVTDPLKPTDEIVEYVGRFDFEKGEAEMAEAYADYLLHNWKPNEKFARLLMIGGKSNKEGLNERHAHMLAKLRGLPDHLQHYFVIPGFKAPHESIIHISSMGIWGSFEEAFDMAEKEKRATRALVALSPVVGHLGTGNKDVPGQTDTAIWFTPSKDWTSYAPAFDAAKDPKKYAHIARAGYDHVQQFDPKIVCAKVIEAVESVKPGFWGNNGLDNIHIPPQVVFGEKQPDQSKNAGVIFQAPQ